MKKYILSTIALLTLCVNLSAQEAKEEMVIFMKDGLVKWESKDKNVKFRVGGRVAIDGAHYIDHMTDRSSGFKLSEARLRVYSTFGNNFDSKFDIDFAGNKVSIKDLYMRYHLGENGMFYVGNYAEPFSASNIQSTASMNFMFKSPTIDALGTGRALGISYRHFTDMYWGELGAFSQKLSDRGTMGDKGWSLSTRQIFRHVPQYSEFGFHVGGSFNFRKADANGFNNGNDEHNRIFNVNSSLESLVDETNFLNATVYNANNVMKYGVEVLGFWRNIYLQGEYLGSTTTRNKDWEYLFKDQLGGLFSYKTMESFQDWYGIDRNINFNGFYIEAGYLLFGGDYEYDSVSALMSRPGKGALELVFRYNHTNLDDVDGEWFDGRFYEDKASGKPNNSVSGGKVNSYTLGANYYITKNVIFKLNYNYQKLDSYQYLDKNLNSIMCRLLFEF